MREKARRALAGTGAALRYGALVALGVGAATFLFAFLTGGLDAVHALDWARRILFLGGAFCLILGAVGLLFSGSEYRDARLGFAKDDVLNSFERVAGISWATAVIVASVDFLALGTVAEVLFLVLG